MGNKKKYTPVNTSVKFSKPKKPKKEIILSEKEVEELLKNVQEMLVYVYLLSDIQELVMTDIISVFKKLGFYNYNMKNDLDRLKSLVEKISHELTNNCNTDQKIEFGEMSDAFKLDLDNFIHTLYNRIEY